MDYALHGPINNLSFGNVFISLLRESYRLGHQPSIFLIGNGADLSAQPEDKDFNNWLTSCINKAYKYHKRSNPCLKLWHFQGSIESVSDKQILLTFHETDSPTPEELNVIKNNHKVIFTNQYTTNNFKEYGCDNIEKIPLGFDSFNFKKIDKKYFSDDRISFNLAGKFEKRKNHAKIIQSWLKKYGNNTKYFLNCAIWNHFINPEQQKNIYQQILQGKRYSNIQFLGFMPQNSLYNDYLNSGDIIIGMSGGEGFGMPEFHSLGLGKHGIILNAHAYKEYSNSDNSILINPNGKEPCYDGMFFHPNVPFNQGNFFTFNEEEFIEGCERVVRRVNTNKLNLKGLEIQDKFSYKDVFAKIYNLLQV